MAENDPNHKSYSGNRLQTPVYVMVADNGRGRPRMRGGPHTGLSTPGATVSVPNLAVSFLLSLAKDLTTKSTIDHRQHDESRKRTQFFTNKTQASMLTPAEEKLLVNIGQGSPKLAAASMGLKIGYIYQRLHSIRLKIKKSRSFLSTIDDYKRTYPRLSKYLNVIDNYEQAN